MTPIVFLQWQHDILDINDIFRDLGTMVHEQGDMIGMLNELQYSRALHIVTSGVSDKTSDVRVVVSQIPLGKDTVVVGFMAPPCTII